jgi:hypothetical protein
MKTSAIIRGYGSMLCTIILALVRHLALGRLRRQAALSPIGYPQPPLQLDHLVEGEHRVAAGSRVDVSELALRQIDDQAAAVGTDRDDLGAGVVVDHRLGGKAAAVRVGLLDMVLDQERLWEELGLCLRPDFTCCSQNGPQDQGYLTGSPSSS